MSSRNKTISLNEFDIKELSDDLRNLSGSAKFSEIVNKVFHQDMLEVSKFLPEAFVDVLFLDPPYNMNKTFNSSAFKKQGTCEYNGTLETWIQAILHTLKPTATVYICGDWHTSTSIYEVASKYFNVHNRITWEREKGRGALSNWKNCSEDIWFCTMSDDFYFNPNAVKLKRKVIAPYRNKDGSAKDWNQSDEGNYRLTSPSNLWTDITVPFWSMAENTKHPTQKPEKLLAKLILASSHEGDVIFDPFMGSGTTAVVAKKLSRRYVAIERDTDYCLYSLKRLKLAEDSRDIQGFSDGVFWERNTLSMQSKKKVKNSGIKASASEQGTFDVMETIA